MSDTFTQSNISAITTPVCRSNVVPYYILSYEAPFPYFIRLKSVLYEIDLVTMTDKNRLTGFSTARQKWL
nr:MAG TPA: hypothetical protein [Bacteriophage sp.]